MELVTLNNIAYAIIGIGSIAIVAMTAWILVLWGEQRGETKAWQEVKDLMPNLEVEV